VDDEGSPGPWPPRPHPSLAVLLAVAVALRVAQIDVGAQVDEVYHVLAGLSWLEEGTFAIGDGVYTRTPGFTVLVAASLELFGDSLVAARIPALAFGLGWIALVFEWTRRVAGLRVAWIVGLFFAFDSGAVHLSQFARFYTLHGLLFWVGAAGVYWLVVADADRARKGLVGATAAASLALAFHFQPSAAIGAVALLAWAAGRWIASAGPDRTQAVSRLLLLVLAASVLAGAAHLSGVLQDVWATYRVPADWARHRADQIRFYHWWLEGRFPVLWRLYPLAVVLTVARRRRVGVYSAVMFVVPILLHSFAGPKDGRYVYYAMPFFYLTWGIAVSEALAGIRTAAEGMWGDAAARTLPTRWRRGLTACTVAAVLAFPLYTSPAFKATIGMVSDDGPDRPYGQPHWTAAARELRPLAEEKDVVLASRAVKAMYYLGRADAEVIFRPPVGAVLRPVNGFEVDERIGLPVLHTRTGLSQFLRCHGSGLVVIERARWAGLEEEKSGVLAETIREATEVVESPGAWGLVVREWTSRADVEGEGCTAVRTLTRRSSTGRPAGRRE
jgi:4-amino-4-deoxy-L-arabinose transferase-like glycosyltransferase